MKHRILSALALSTLVLPAAIVAAQAAAPPPPPSVLVIVREYLKPGKGGSLHAKTEGAYVKAMADAKFPTHYFAVDSMTGPTRALFITGYDNFDAWGKDMAAQQAEPLASALDQANIEDGDLLAKTETSAYLYHPEYSVHPNIEAAHMRYWEFTMFVVKPGHEKEWSDLVKLYTTGFDKFPEAHWAIFESMYGENNGGVYISINPMRSLNEVDKGMANSKAFMAGMGDEGMKKASVLADACLQSVQTNVFVVNPKMSYPSDEWATAAPEIWGQH
ncbi:MAG: hypothetical protein WB622_12060 [Acidobacteriaceae bacterium]